MKELMPIIIYYVVCFIVIFLYYKKRKIRMPFDVFGYTVDATFGEKFTISLLICIPLFIEFFIL
tara:strand:+ start:4276 stop:4467 length:192 start_codon:yes stop_codon:yes gene_type:complete